MNALPRPTAKCYDCEEDRPGEYVHRVWFCTDCLLRMCRSDKNQYIRDRDYWKKKAGENELLFNARVLELEKDMQKSRELGMEMVNAAEATGMVLNQKNNKSRFIVAVRNLREFLCQR